MTVLRSLLVALGFALLLVAGQPLFAAPPGDVVFEGKTEGPVTFKHETHTKDFKCAECHPAVFKMKKGGSGVTMDGINEGKFCGTCHNGEKAFKANEEASCTKCHVKAGEPSPSPQPPQ